MPALTATSVLVDTVVLVGTVMLLGAWSGRRWGRRRKHVLDTEARKLPCTPSHKPVEIEDIKAALDVQQPPSLTRTSKHLGSTSNSVKLIHEPENRPCFYWSEARHPNLRIALSGPTCNLLN